MNLFILDTHTKGVDIDHGKRCPHKGRKGSKSKNQFGQLGEKQDCQSSNPSVYSHVNVLNLIKYARSGKEDTNWKNVISSGTCSFFFFNLQVPIHRLKILGPFLTNYAFNTCWVIIMKSCWGAIKRIGRWEREQGHFECDAFISFITHAFVLYNLSSWKWTYSYHLLYWQSDISSSQVSWGMQEFMLLQEFMFICN